MDADQLQQILQTLQAGQQQFLASILDRLPGSQQDAIGNRGTSNPSFNLNPFENFDANKEKFTCYIERFENYLSMKDVTDMKKKAQLLCVSIGSTHYNGLTAFLGPSKPVKTLEYDDLIKHFKDYLAPHQSVIVSQHRFLAVQQTENQKIAEFVTALQQNIVECEFVVPCSKEGCNEQVSVADLFLRTQFIRGLKEPWIRRLILQSKSTKFEDIVLEAIALEASKISSNEVQLPATSNKNDVHKVKSVKPANFNKKTASEEKNASTYEKNLSTYPYQKPESKNEANIAYRQKSRINFQELGIDHLCLRCGYSNHPTEKCFHPKEKFTCTECRKVGHVSKVCISTLLARKKSKNSTNQNSLHLIDESDGYDTEPEYDVKAIYEPNDGKENILIPINVNGVDISPECDTGSRKAIISKELYQDKFSKFTLHDDEIALFRDYQHNIFKALGYVKATVKYKNRSIEGKMWVTDRSKSSVIGREWLFPLKIVKIDNVNAVEIITEVDRDTRVSKIISEFPEVFNNKIGKVPDYKISYQLKKDAKPIYIPSRKPPYALLPAIDRCIDNLIKNDVLEKVDVSEWGTPAVYIEKPDKSVRLCGNYKITINKQIEDVIHPMPTIEDIFVKMANGQYYCKLDLKDAYLHLEVDDQTAIIQALTTHRGTFRVKRLYYGSKVAPAEFHKFIDQLVKDLTGTTTYFDDIVVQGRTINECENRLRILLMRLQKYNLRVNLKKCRFFEESIEYLGHNISVKGLHKSKKKVIEIENTPEPTNLKEAQQFIGLVNYYHNFIPKASDILAPIYQLFRKNAEFIWDKKCSEAFKMVKKIINSDQVLTSYQPSLPLVLATDASPTGIAAILSHRFPDGTEKPILFRSRSLTDSEKKYSQLDREALALFWGARKFYQYIYGRSIIFQIDNKPMKHILDPAKELPAFTTSRLERYAIYLSQFDYKIEHRKSEEHANADFFSRYPVEKYPVNLIDECYYLQNERIQTLHSASNLSPERIQKATRQDPELMKIFNALQNGTATEEFSLHDGIVCRGTRVYIPKLLQQDVLNELHYTHVGIVKMKAIARNYVYWKSIDTDIENMVKACSNCAIREKQPAKAPIHKWEDAQYAFQRIHMDYAEIFGTHLLIIVDAFSKWLEVYISKKPPTSNITIEFLSDFFARFGLPEELVSDNASIFKSSEFVQFTESYQINHRFSAPNYPATNGQAERFVQTVKSKLYRMENDTNSLKCKIRAILMKYRITPTPNGRTPSELVFGKTIRNSFDLLRPANQKIKGTSENLPVRTLPLGARVKSRNYERGKLWKFGTIVEKLGKLHYLVELDDGYVLKRHINQLTTTEVEQQWEPTENFRFPILNQNSQSTTQESVEQPSIELGPTNANPTGAKHHGSNQPANHQADHQRTTSATTQTELRKSSRARRPPDRLNL